jgi:hypothetical protein
MVTLTGPRSFAILVISLALCICFIKSQPLEPWCRTRAPHYALSDSVNPTMIFTWTRNSSALSDPVSWLLDTLDYNSVMQANNNDYCEYYKSYYETQDPKTREYDVKMLRAALGGSNRMCGYGVYFAENPTDSAVDYGSYLVAVALPPNVTAGVYIDNLDSVNVTQAVLSDYEAIIYKWFTSSALVLRGNNILRTTPDNKIFAASFDFTPRETRKEIWKLQPYTGPFEVPKFLDNFRDFIHSTLFASREPNVINGTLTTSGKLYLMGFQWFYRFEDSMAACQGNRTKSYYVAYNINADTLNSIEWDELVTLLVKADYLNESDLPSIPPGDLKTLKIFLVAKYDQKDVDQVGLNFVVNYAKLGQITPRISTWKYF